MHPMTSTSHGPPALRHSLDLASYMTPVGCCWFGSRVAGRGVGWAQGLQPQVLLAAPLRPQQQDVSLKERRLECCLNNFICLLEVWQRAAVASPRPVCLCERECGAVSHLRPLWCHVCPFGESAFPRVCVRSV